MQKIRYIKHHGVMGMHWGKRLARGIQDRIAGKTLRVGAAPGQSNASFDRQFAKESGISVRKQHLDEKVRMAARAKLAANIKSGASRAKAALSKIGNRMYSAYPAKNRKKAAIVDIALASAIVGGIVLHSLKNK